MRTDIAMLTRLYAKLRDRRLTRDEKIACLTGIIAVGFGAVVLFYYYRYEFLGIAFGERELPLAAFGDFFGSIDMWGRRAFNGVGIPMAYFPGMYLFLNMLSGFYQAHPWGALIGFVSVFICFFMAYVWLQLKSANPLETARRVLICTFMTYPVVLTFNTGNYEAAVFVLIVLFFSLYRGGHAAFSALPLAMAISMKLFPAVFLVLFIADKKYREFLYACGGVVVLTLMPLLVFDGGLRDGAAAYLDRLQASQKKYFDLMVLDDAGNHFGHSFLNGVRAVMGDAFPPMQHVLLPWMLVAAAVFAAVAAYVVLVETAFWKKVALLVICMCLLPYTSTDYKLMHFFIPLFLFINNEKDAAGSKNFDTVYIVLFGLLLILKSYVSFHGVPEDNLNVALNPLLMILMMAVIMGSGIADGGWRRAVARFAP